MSLLSLCVQKLSRGLDSSFGVSACGTSLAEMHSAKELTGQRCENCGRLFMKFAGQEVLMEFPLLTVMSLCPQERKEHVHTDLEVTIKAREILPGSVHLAT